MSLSTLFFSLTARFSLRRLFALCCCLVLLSGCKRHEPAITTRFVAFDQLFSLTLVGVDQYTAKLAATIAESDFQQMEQAWQLPLPRVNRLLATNQRFAVAPSLKPLIAYANGLSVQSRGLINPAIGGLLQLWQFNDANQECRPPPAPQAIADWVKADPQIQQLELNGIHLKAINPAVQLTFDSFIKGYASDQAIQHVRELGIRNAMLSAHNDVRVIGSRDGLPWRVPIHRPSGGILAMLDIEGDESVFTADRYAQDFVYQGEHYHRTLDPRTGYPANLSQSVTVIHENALTADAAATALFIAGPQHWQEIANAMQIKYVLLVDPEGRLHMNPAMQERLTLLQRDPKIVVSSPLLTNDH